ncbi:MAG: hypothetical protein WBA44_03020 [Mesorhizobium sp.]
MRQQASFEPTWREVLQYPGIPLVAGAALICGAFAPNLADLPTVLSQAMLLLGGMSAGYGLTVTPPQPETADHRERVEMLADQWWEWHDNDAHLAELRAASGGRFARR